MELFIKDLGDKVESIVSNLEVLEFSRILPLKESVSLLSDYKYLTGSDYPMSYLSQTFEELTTTCPECGLELINNGSGCETCYYLSN